MANRHDILPGRETEEGCREKGGLVNTRQGTCHLNMNARSAVTNGLVTSKILAPRTGFLSLGLFFSRSPQRLNQKYPLLNFILTKLEVIDVWNFEGGRNEVWKG